MSASRARRSARRVSFEISANIPTRRRRPELQRGAPMFSQDRDQLRQVFIESWRKFRADEALQPLEQLIAQAIHAHPEYHALSDRPPGIRARYQRLAARLDDAHDAEHRIAECMSAALGNAQRAGTAPDEADYLECVRKL